MDIQDLIPSGDLPPDHPLVLEALKGMISGPISQLRTEVDGLITNPSTALQKGIINYEKILPKKEVFNNIAVDSSNLSYTGENILNKIIPNNPDNFRENTVKLNEKIILNESPNMFKHQKEEQDQMELGLFKSADIDSVYKKLFDIENKIDTLFKYVKKNLNS
jgi:hypothetical protein